jgi:hypothetical protein
MVAEEVVIDADVIQYMKTRGRKEWATETCICVFSWP